MPALTRPQAEQAVADGARAYFNGRRARVTAFVTAHFSLQGTLALHRAALGWDILKAPLNLTLAVPQIALHLAAAAARKLGAPRLAACLHRSLILPTAVARQVEWLIQTDLLELPYAQPNRQSTTDALAQAILATPILQSALAHALPDIAAQSADPAFRARLAGALQTYGLSRAAAAEITTGLMNIGIGALTLNKLTPGAATLGPALAGIMAHQTAISAFPLGAWLGTTWYGLFPAAPSAALLAGTTAGAMLAATTFAAFAGVVSDPIQRALGLHQRRLTRLIDGLERQFFNPAAPGFAVHDHYVARLLDVFDMLGAALRAAGI